MYEYPPPQLSIFPIVIAVALQLLVFISVGYGLLRRKHEPLVVDPILWCAATVPVLIVMDTIAFSFPGSSNSRDGLARAVLFATPLLGIPLGLIIVVISTMKRTKSGPATLFAAIFGILGSLFLFAICVPALRTPPTVHWQRTCKYNMRDIADAFRTYHDEHDAFPAAVAGAPPVSWRVTLLPFLEHQGLFKRYDQSAAWDAPVNAPLMSEFVRELTCPAMWNERRRAGERVPTSYVAPTGPGTLFAGPDPPTFRTMRDGTSNTILVLEACGANIVWSEPRDIDVSSRPPGVNLPGSLPGASDGVFSSLHAGMAQVALGDGTVRVVRNETDPAVLKRLFDPIDGEPIGEF